MTTNDDGVLKDGQVVGGEGGDEGKKEPAVEMVAVEIGGVKVNVPKVFADQYATVQGEVTKLSADMKAMVAATKKTAVDAGVEDPLKDIDVLLFSDPKAAIAKILAVARQQVVGEVNATSAATAAQKDFWDEFYKQNKDLDRETDGDVINAILNKEYASLKDMRVPEAIRYLAGESKKALLKIAIKRGGKEGEPKVNAEGANEPSGEGSKKDKSVSTDQPQSLSSVLRARRAARAAGSTVKAK